MTLKEHPSTTNPNDTLIQRRDTLAALRAKGEAYPNHFKRTHYLGDIFKAHQHKDQPTLQQDNVTVKVAGRVMTKRVMGKVTFLDLQDMSHRLQVYMRSTDLNIQTTGGPNELDLGDIIGIEGVIFRTKTGELSIHATSFWLLTKSLRPLPDKFHGLQDTESRYRQRYLDLITNPKTRVTFKKRATLFKAIREFFDKKQYIEVETPMMQPIAGGAVARPFMTHHNALNMPLYLRIAPELYLKRLVVGGFEQVYEINRNFRNEGLSTRHNPEFTMLEFYKAYADCNDAMDITEALLKEVTYTVLGSATIEYQNEQYDLSKPLRLTVVQALLRYHPTLTQAILEDFSALQQWVQPYKLKNAQSLGELQFSLFEETVESQLRQPTFITEHPIEVSPLARATTHNPKVADRFELYIGGRELANGFSELNDPEDQARRFESQLAAREKGDAEAMLYDKDYIKALEYALPPTAGVGIGIDRLMMLLADATSIRDVVLFPLLRPET